MWLPKITDICGNLVYINIDIWIPLPRNKSDVHSHVQYWYYCFSFLNLHEVSILPYNELCVLYTSDAFWIKYI